MHLDLVPPQVTQIPPWKLELLSRRSALSRTVEPKLNGVCLNPVPEQSASSESNVKAPPKCFTSWKELKDGAGVAHTYSINNSQRPLSSESRTFIMKKLKNFVNHRIFQFPISAKDFCLDIC